MILTPSESSDKCAKLKKRITRQGTCSDPADGPQTDAKCQKKYFALCNQGCVEEIPGDMKKTLLESACLDYSGFTLPCKQLLRRWNKKSCEVDGDEPTKGCKVMFGLLERSGCEIP